MRNCYIERTAGNIVSLFARPQYDGQEKLPEDDPEIIAFKAEQAAPPTNDEIYDQAMQNQAVLKAMALAINDGSFVPGANLSNADLKTLIKGKM